MSEAEFLLLGPVEVRAGTTTVAIGEGRVRSVLAELLLGANRLVAELGELDELTRDDARDSEQVRPLLPAAPGCLTVVTSRRRLTGLVAAHAAGSLTLNLLRLAKPSSS